MILFRKNSRTATIMPYLCIVNLREEIYAPTRKNLRAHGGGGFSHRNATLGECKNLKIKDYGIESKSKGTVAEHRQVLRQRWHRRRPQRRLSFRHGLHGLF